MRYSLIHELKREKASLQDFIRWYCFHRKSPLRYETFRFNGRNYLYCIHHHNHTWRNERAIEIPIFLNLLHQYPPEVVLEIGNVLSHYRRLTHDVVDKYEISFRRSIIREDVLTYTPKRRYDLCISISTFEHIGLDEGNKDQEKILGLTTSFQRFLNPGGRVIFSIPLGYNLFLDESIFNGKVPLANCSFMHRVSADNRWEQTDMFTAFKRQYGKPYPSANALLIGEYRENDDR